MSIEIGQRVRRMGGSVRDGQIGRVVARDDGTLGVKLDRAAENLVVPYHETEWHPETRSAIQPMQLARILFEADRALRLARGEYGASDWVSLREQERVRWCQEGPPPKADEERLRLARAILGALKEK